MKKITLSSLILVLFALQERVNAFGYPLNSRSLTKAHQAHSMVPGHSRQGRTSLGLFFGDAGRSTTSVRPKVGGIPLEFLEALENGADLPYQFEYNDASQRTRTIRVKQLESKDVNAAVGLCLKEYGSYPSSNPSTNNDEISKMIQAKMDDLDNFIFSFVVLLGLGQRVERREKSDENPSHPQDHNVLCITEVDSNHNEFIFGMAEVSLQPPDPARTSPPFVVPTNLKKVFSFVYGAPDPSPYISNVLVTNDFRGKGYSRVLMSACEGIAKSWGYESAYLHVDADARSGAAAQCLYRSLGYEPVIDHTYNDKFAWMGIDAVNRGLYIVDGVALLFLKKNL